MPVSKCNNCGANIPPGASFCPNCGAQKAAEQPIEQQVQPQPVARQPVISGQNSLQIIFDKLFAEHIVLFMVLLGVLFACIGGLIFMFSVDLTVYRLGIILNTLGFLFMGVFLIMGGLANRIFDKNVRLGMIIAGALILTFSLSVAV